ncbi:MAG: AI-2E family transporter [Desulfobacteraceae bacterium]|nr:AI-2E family transporter [Desulfobacteraceae bacterium]
MGQNTSERDVFIFFLVLFSVSLFFTWKVIAPFFSIIILGIVCAGIFHSFYKLLSKKIKPAIASLVICVFIFFIVLIPVLFFIGVVSKEAFDLYIMGKDAVFSDYLKKLLYNTQLLERLNQLIAYTGIEQQLTFDDLIEPISELGKTVGFFLFEQARFIASNLLKFIFYFCFMLVIVFYSLMDNNKVIKFINDLSPLPDKDNEKLLNKFMDMAGAVLLGNGLGGLIQGFIGGAMFMMLGLNSPFLWGVIMGFLAFLPIVGIGLVLVPTGILLILQERVIAGIFVIIFYGVLSWTIEYLFKPKVVGDRVSMHPLIVFFAIIGGLKIYGMLGIIYGPLIITLFFTLSEIYFANYQVLIEPDKVNNKK